MSGINQLEQLAQLAQSFTNQLDISGLIDSISQQVSAQSASTIASAVGELTDAGLDPKDYIATPRSTMKAKQHQLRLDIEKAQAAQRLQHEQEIHALELRKYEAEIKVREAQASRMSAPVPAPPATAHV